MKNSRSNVCKRQQDIINTLKEVGSINVDAIAKELNVSQVTIRRDLAFLENKGVIKRFHGGANILSNMHLNKIGISPAEERYILKKHSIAELAASFIENDDVIFINSSSTALLIIEYIKNKNITVVTNNCRAIEYKDSHPNIDLILTGGRVYDKKSSMVGEFTTQTLSRIKANKSFLGVGGISVKSGITTSVFQETSINEMMLNNCTGGNYILADNSKIAKSHNFIVSDISSVSIIVTDKDADSEELEQFMERNIEVYKTSI